MRALLAIVLAVAVAACASIGRPQGGPKDETPPVYLRSNPSPGETNFNDQQINIFFDENVKVEDVVNKVVVSPAQQTQPSVVANGRRLYVTLRDTLLPDMTYTIDFSDAIRDLNEGNILDGFAIDFSTGDIIDTLRISGMVFDAATLEPAQGMIVGAYTNLADSAISTLRVERITKTNQLGQFTLRNLKATEYRLFALNDLNRDYHWDRSEDIAFYNAPIIPWAEEIEVTDTLTASDGSDSIVSRKGVSYYPNDILLTWFNENYKAQYLRNYTRNERNKIQMEFAAPSDTFPILTITNGEYAGKDFFEVSRLQYTIERDTLDFWIEDSTIILQDSLLLEAKYLRTDSTDALSWTTDTLKFIYKEPRSAQKEREKAEKDKIEKEKRRQERIAKAKETGDSALLADTMPEPEKIKFLDIKTAGSTQEYNKPLVLQFDQPLRNIDQSKISLEWKEDSTWIPYDSIVVLKPDTAGKILEYHIDIPWDYGMSYKLQIDSAAITGIYDVVNDKFSNEFTVKSADEYSTLIFNITSQSYWPEKPFDWEHKDSISADSIILPEPSVTENIIIQASDSIINDSTLVLTDSLTASIDSIQPINSNEPPLPPIIVQLLSNNDSPVASAKVIDGKARFDFVAPGTYYARAFIDVNDNGIWDPGKLLEWRQAEDVYYYPKKINLKKNWDLEQSWDLFETPIDQQKPYDILKNKPKTKENDGRNTEEDEEDEEAFGNNNFIYGAGTTTYGNGSQYNNARMNNR